MDEHRANKRANVNVRVAYRDNVYGYTLGRASSISRGGMFIVTNKPSESLNEFLTASIDVEDLGKIVWAQGRVIRKTSTGMGVAFTRVDSKGLDLFLSYLGIPF
jgi:hypothetical protein